MKSKQAYTVLFERDEGGDGWWVVTVKGVKGPLTQARSISQGKTRIREALGLFVDDAATAELVVDVRIPAEEKRAIARARQMQRDAERAQRDAAAAARKVARELVARMSLRDAAEVMGVSGGRMQQLVAE